jgi:hypothetical protein
MLTKLQKIIIDAAAAEGFGTLKDVFAVAAGLQDFEAIVYMVDNYLQIFPKEMHEITLELRRVSQECLDEIAQEEAAAAPVTHEAPVTLQ